MFRFFLKRWWVLGWVDQLRTCVKALMVMESYIHRHVGSSPFLILCWGLESRIASVAPPTAAFLLAPPTAAFLTLRLPRLHLELGCCSVSLPLFDPARHGEDDGIADVCGYDVCCIAHPVVFHSTCAAVYP